MATISDLASASATLRNAAGRSEDEYDRQIRDHVKYCRQLLSTKALESIARDDSLFVVSFASPSARFHNGQEPTNNINCRILIQETIRSPIFFFFDYRSRLFNKCLVIDRQQIYYPQERCGRGLHATWNFLTASKSDMLAWNGANSLSSWRRPQKLLHRQVYPRHGPGSLPRH